MYSKKQLFTTFAHVWLFVCLTTLLGACNASQQAGNSSDTDSHIGLAASPQGMDGEQLIVTLLDDNAAPVTDALVSLEGNMNHAGMVPVISEEVADDADGSVDGLYHVPFQFTMMGDWVVTVNVQWADGTTTTRDIDVTANNDGIIISQAGAVISSGDLSILHAMARPVPVAGGNGAIYLKIANRGSVAEQLLSATSPLAPAELHETIDDNGILRMRMQTDGFAIPAGGRLTLQPGGKHIMLLGIDHTIEAGQTISLTLAFANAPSISLAVPVLTYDSAQTGTDDAMDHANH